MSTGTSFDDVVRLEYSRAALLRGEVTRVAISAAQVTPYEWLELINQEVDKLRPHLEELASRRVINRHEDIAWDTGFAPLLEHVLQARVRFNRDWTKYDIAYCDAIAPGDLAALLSRLWPPVSAMQPYRTVLLSDRGQLLLWTMEPQQTKRGVGRFEVLTGDSLLDLLKDEATGRLGRALIRSIGDLVKACIDEQERRLLTLKHLRSRLGSPLRCIQE